MGLDFDSPKTFLSSFIIIYFFKVFVYFHKYYLLNTGLKLIICNSYNLKAYNTILRNAHYNHCWTIHLYNNTYGLADTCLVSNQIVRLWSLKGRLRQVAFYSKFKQFTLILNCRFNLIYLRFIKSKTFSAQYPQIIIFRCLMR